MRLIGIGVLALLLIGSLIILGQTGAFDAALGKGGSDAEQRIDDYQLAATRSFDVSGSDVFVTHVDTDAPIVLSGLPSFTGASFRMPTDARPIAGRYRLYFRSRVADGVEGALRVSINGVRRGDLLLTNGIRQESVDIELTPSELSAGELDVNLSLQGRGEIAECTPEDSIAAVVEIEPRSGIQLTLNNPANSARDKLALWGGRVPVGWSANSAGSVKLRSVINAARLSSKGYAPHFVPNGLTGDELSTLAGEAAPRKNSFVPESYPVPLAGESGNQGVRTFGRRASWRYSYAARDMPGETLPTALDLRMIVGPQAEQLRRDLTVTLNDSLLFSRRLPADAERLNQSIAIPAGAQRGRNALEITMSVSDEGSQRCGDIEQSVVEMLPETVLRGGGARANDALSLLRDRLIAGSTVTLTGGDLTSADAEAASLLLSRLGARRMEFKSSGAQSNIRIASGDVAAASRAASGGETWVVYSSRDDGRDVVARSLSEFGSVNRPAVALFVTVPKQAGLQTSSAAGIRGQAVAAAR